MRQNGVNKEISALLAASIFVPKEYLYDMHPSPSDLVMAEYEFYNHTSNGKNTRMTITIFGDKAVFITFKKKF